MTAPNLELNDDPTLEQNDGADHIDGGDTTPNIESQNPAPVVPQIDYAALYRESVAERRRLEEEADRLRQAQQQKPQYADEEITDEYFEKHGTAKGVKTIVESVIAKQLRESLGDIGELSQDFKRGKQIASAEERFFQEFPQLGALKDPLTTEVRKYLQNAPSVDVNTYRSTALAMIGALTAQNFNPAAAQQTQPQTQPTPSVPSAPAPRGGAQIRKPVRKLTEFERTAMRQAGFDPNKSESIEEFFRIVEGDDGVTV